MTFAEDAVMQNAKPFRLPSEASFLKALNRIAAAKREPTSWEAECLLAALRAMAVRNSAMAERHIAACRRVTAEQRPPVQEALTITVDSFRGALSKVKERLSRGMP